jgi:hypothetical protein
MKRPTLVPPKLAAITRACTKIIDDVNGIELKDLRPVARR